MRQAITTKYLGPTNSRGSRVKGTAAAGSVTIPWDDALNSEGNHLAAAQAVAARFGWTGMRMIGGGLPTEDGNVYVFDDELPANAGVLGVASTGWEGPAIDALLEGDAELAMEVIHNNMATPENPNGELDFLITYWEEHGPWFRYSRGIGRWAGVYDQADRDELYNAAATDEWQGFTSVVFLDQMGDSRFPRSPAPYITDQIAKLFCGLLNRLEIHGNVAERVNFIKRGKGDD